MQNGSGSQSDIRQAAYIVSLCVYQIGTFVTAGTFGLGTIAAFLLVIGFLYLLFRPYRESQRLTVPGRAAGKIKA